ncbi:MAG: hypothetical protein RBT75_10195 [Anaerolineae bacterium]|nr:hypothetical protein [Anaerolineae bacterium]
MIVTQTHIDELLATLKALRGHIEVLKARVAELMATEMEAALVQAYKEYEAQLKPFNEEASRLRNEQAVLQTRLAQLVANSTVAASDPTAARPDVTTPEPVPTFEDKPAPLPPPPPDPRGERKRKLADYILDFVSEEQEEVVMQVINAILVDESKDIGDILEALAWGDIWSIRAGDESLEVQFARLNEWRAALEGRVIFWKTRVQSLESESRYTLWEVKKQGEAQWQALLEDWVQKQAAENKRLAHEVAVLQRQLQANTA